MQLVIARPVSGTGYVVDCLRSAHHALAQPTYEAVVRAAIPRRWLDRLRDRAVVEPLLTGLVRRRIPAP